ncbi:MAG: hypothetical protein JWM67_786 [Mycobacterium sp.]|nr:hypothetical protein [Mycobacterium sp.]
MASTAVHAPDPAQAHQRTTLWVTTVGVFLAFVNSSIVLISLPAIFRGLKLNPLDPNNVSYLLWLLLGYMVVTAVLVVTAGRLGDMFGRARCFTAGFVVFTLGALVCAVDPLSGGGGALFLIIARCVQGVGGALLMANSTALLTDAFPAERRGTAVGINQVFGLAGSFVGLLIGGLIADTGWRLVFWVSVVPGAFATVLAAKVLRDSGRRVTVKLDLLGNITFGIGLVGVLVGISYGIQPYGGHITGWTSPFVLGATFGGLAFLVLFVLVERRVDAPMFDLALFRIRAFNMGNIAGLLSSIARGGMQFMLIIWLQGIWLPQHGYAYEKTPLWAGIYLVPLTAGFLIAGPISGWLSDRFGARPFATGGMLITAATFAVMLLLPANFNYPVFAALLFINGVGSALFASPNTTGVMNSVPAAERGIASGMRATFQNSGQVISIGLFFTLLVIGLSSSLPGALQAGFVAHGVPVATAHAAASLPPVAVLFAAFLGYNPVGQLLGQHTLAALPPDQAAILTGGRFFPQAISTPFTHGIAVVFTTSIVLCVAAAGASWLRGGKYVADEAGPGEAPLRDIEEPGELAVPVTPVGGVR